MGPQSTGAPDALAEELVEPAAQLARRWFDEGRGKVSRRERRDADRLRALTADADSVAFAMAFTDRVLRPEDDSVAAEQLQRVAAGRTPAFLSRTDAALLRAGAAAAPWAPHAVMPATRARLRQLVGDLVLDATPRPLAAALGRLRADGFAVNVNLLGEAVLGDAEAARRLAATVALLRRPDVSYVSVKASSVAARLNLWAQQHSTARVATALREVLAAAASRTPAAFVNLDMEEYKDLRITIDAFTTVLDEPDFRSLEAGIVLQGYLPDSVAALAELVSWATARVAAGGAGIKVRLVKGANLAMERVDAAMHGWQPAPYPTKAEVDANYLRLLDWALTPQRLQAVRIGVASHNLFDVAFALLLAGERGVRERVQFEMLQGMAPGLARAVRDTAGGLLLYTPVVAPRDFDNALAYLFRRLEENAGGENFLHRLFERDARVALDDEQRRFATAVADRWRVSDSPRRRDRPPRRAGFANEPDSDPTDPLRREAILAALDRPLGPAPERVADPAVVDRAVAAARESPWRRTSPGERRRVLLAVADELAARRPELIAVMARETGKTVAEGDPEVSEAVDYARYYADAATEADTVDGAVFAPLGVVAVAPPWNFPVAIPAGGVLAALAAGNAVLLKPAPEAVACSAALAAACWAAGVPRSALQLLVVPDGPVGEHLIGHAGVDALVLTGAFETAEAFARMAPGKALFAETSGKNAIVVCPDADLDLAAADVIHSAFGHAGQKCSAASLVIAVGAVARSARFRRQLVDAAGSLVVGPGWQAASEMGPLIAPPAPKLRRALTDLEPGQSWLLQPRRVGSDGELPLWSPGIVDGVAPGSFFHQTECFGPVLGLMTAADLDEAIAMQNAVPFGLTGGLHTLDPANVAYWLDRVQVGNAYVNRGTTGAIVRRQPFGGWKRSVVGPGAKAGGPNYVGQLGSWRDGELPALRAEPAAAAREIVAGIAGLLGAAEREWLDAAVASDAYWWVKEFSVGHDPSGLFCEANVFRYRPLQPAVVRVAADARAAAVARVLAAATLACPRVAVSADPAAAAAVGGFPHRVEEPATFARWVAASGPDRVRLVGTEEPPSWPGVATYLDRRAVVASGRVELARYLREQSISHTVHRFGNLTGSNRAP